MLILSLSTLIQEAIADPQTKHLSGNIRPFDELLRPENLQRLEARHKGLFAYLAFHPGVDVDLSTYVREGSLSSDAGPNILVLFTLDADARSPSALSEDAFDNWLDLDTAVHPSYQLVRFLFEPKASPPLPGVVFFENFSSAEEAIYLSLQGLSDAKAIRERLRALFSTADHAFRQGRNKPDEAFADLFSIELQKQKLTYQRSGRTSIREWLVRAYQIVGEHTGDIVSVLGLFIR